MNITESELQTLIIFSLRYALGRRTAAVTDCSLLIIKYWNKLDDWAKELIKKEIKEAVRRNLAGDECDVNEWNAILKL